jgi:hypothetical protein
MVTVKVEFLQDYRGKLTNEAYFVAGAVVEFDDAIASQLIAEGRAKPIAGEPKPTGIVEAATATVTPKPKKPAERAATTATATTSKGKGKGKGA